MDIAPVEKFFRCVLIAGAAAAVLAGPVIYFKVSKKSGHTAVMPHTTPAPEPGYLSNPDSDTQPPVAASTLAAPAPSASPATATASPAGPEPSTFSISAANAKP